MRPFNVSTYMSVLKLAIKNGYSITRIGMPLSKRHPVMILRHDVDLCLESAVKMAKLENKMGISATYFILLYDDFYNPLSHENKSIIKEISRLGHEIGLHWDSRDYTVQKEENLKRDLKLLSDIVGKPIASGSQHEPTDRPLMEMDNLIRYEAYRDFKNINYVSDSSMKWRKHTPWDLIKKRESFQFLAHPFWWIMEGETRRQKFNNYAHIRSKSSQSKIYKRYRGVEEFLKIRREKDSYFGYNKFNSQRK